MLQRYEANIEQRRADCDMATTNAILDMLLDDGCSIEDTVAAGFAETLVQQIQDKIDRAALRR